MSHFPVTIIGENPEAQLAPYHQFESTGFEDQYVKLIDVRAEYLQEYNETSGWDSFEEFISDYYGIDKVEFGKEPDFEEEHQFGYYTVDAEGNVKSVIKRTNPNYKWDWYVLGGRWQGYLMKKMDIIQPNNINKRTPSIQARRCDSLRKGDIDFEGKMLEAAQNAEIDYDNFWSIVKDCKTPLTWKEVNERYKDDQEARSIYHSQEAIIAVANAIDDKKMRYFESYEDYGNSKEAYVEKCKMSSILTYAYIKDGEWFAKGEMGWFGVSHNEMDFEQWTKNTYQMLMDLPDDTLISIYDCHI